jgi:hypothetical protein
VGLGALLVQTSFEALPNLSPSIHKALVETHKNYMGYREQKLHLLTTFQV